jgi:ABC-type bacteriocin/lantibiotic exporter with double-glycine peptidase domain
MHPAKIVLETTTSYQVAIFDQPTQKSQVTHVKLKHAITTLVRIAQLDPSQYDSQQEYETWAPSACSTTSMTEIINSYGHSYRIHDILQQEISVNAISADEGLLDADGIRRTVKQFGFSATSLTGATAQSIIKLANEGNPILIDFPPSSDWPKGHILVVIGGNDAQVQLADSSPIDWTWMSMDRFVRDWNGFATLITPL